MNASVPIPTITDPEKLKAFWDEVCFGSEEHKIISIGGSLLGILAGKPEITTSDIREALAGLAMDGFIGEAEIVKMEKFVMPIFAKYAGPDGPNVAPRSDDPPGR